MDERKVEEGVVFQKILNHKFLVTLRIPYDRLRKCMLNVISLYVGSCLEILG